MALVLALVLLYFTPAIIAAARSKRNMGAIFALNLFLGWTLIGWVVSLVWSLTADPPMMMVAHPPPPLPPSYPQQPYPPQQPPYGQLPTAPPPTHGAGPGVV